MIELASKVCDHAMTWPQTIAIIAFFVAVTVMIYFILRV